jgi:hypothetical protein
VSIFRKRRLPTSGVFRMRRKRGATRFSIPLRFLAVPKLYHFESTLTHLARWLGARGKTKGKPSPGAFEPHSKRESYRRLQRARRHEVRSAERRQEVV